MRSGNRTSVYTGQLVSAYICYGHLSDIPCYRCLGRKQWTIYLFVTTPKKSNGCYTEQRWLLFGFCIANEVSCKPIRAIFGLPLCVGHQTLTRILADSADMTTYCRKSAAAETKAGFVDALVRILMHYEKEILSFRLHLYLVTYPVIHSPHPSSQCRDHRISLILAEEACTPPAQRANEKLTLPRVYDKGASHYWVQPFLVSPSSTCFKYFRCYTRLVAISQSSFTPDGVPIVCPLDYGLLFLIGCSLIGYTEFER
ncbi:hypothetical protein T03_8519 [Trichinella britovi]|uniref:Uncharacterized protein n=1 Tax=Trichinella britovi TaxID=45882 RepID=A0A0V1CXQ3_TRIBR|nr:hypothetical protein T03_8519 [Trichinella britovi]